MFHQHGYNFLYRRVHITQATLDYLVGEYEVEAGMGGTRNQYLRDHCVTTYFIVPPARRRKVLVFCICWVFLVFMRRDKKVCETPYSTTKRYFGATIIITLITKFSQIVIIPQCETISFHFSRETELFFLIKPIAIETYLCYTIVFHLREQFLNSTQVYQIHKSKTYKSSVTSVVYTMSIVRYQFCLDKGEGGGNCFYWYYIG